MHREGIIGSDGVRLLTFSPLSPLYFAVYFLSLLRNDTRRVRWPLATATRLHRIRWNPFAHIFHSLLNSTLLYIFKYLANWHTATRLHRIWWSPAVCRHVFPPSPQLFTFCLVVHGLCPSDSVWVYWTTFTRSKIARHLLVWAYHEWCLRLYVRRAYEALFFPEISS